jgi:predicted PurR-regulated permease PerM
MVVMDTLLGLLGVVGFIIGIIALAAAVTFLIIKLTPQRKPKPKPDAAS